MERWIYFDRGFKFCGRDIGEKTYWMIQSIVPDPIYITSSIDPQLTGFRVFCPAPLAPGRKTCAPTRGAVCTLSHPVPVTTFCVTSQSLILLLIRVRLSSGPMGPIFGRDVHACHVDPLPKFQPSTCCAWFRAAVSVQSPHMPILK